MIEFFENLVAGDRNTILLCSAAYFALVGVYSLIHMYRISRWPSVIGQLHEENIVGSDVGKRDENNYRATVRYTYVVDGVPYENDKINAWIILLSHNLRALLNWQFRYIDRHNGSDVTVFYHPGKPEKAYLVVPGWKQMVLVFALCFGAATLILLAL